MGKLLLFGYLKLFCFPNFSQRVLFGFYQKNIPCLPYVRSKRRTEKIPGRGRSGSLKWEPRSVTLRQRGRTRLSEGLGLQC